MVEKVTDSSNANDAAAAELLHDFDVEYDEPAQFRTVRLERCFAGSDGPLADVDPGPPRCKVWAAGGNAHAAHHAPADHWERPEWNCRGSPDRGEESPCASGSATNPTYPSSRPFMQFLRDARPRG